MKLMCAWCEREGRPSALSDVEPLENHAETHGLCSEHRAQWLKSLGLPEPPRPDRYAPPSPPS